MRETALLHLNGFNYIDTVDTNFVRKHDLPKFLATFLFDSSMNKSKANPALAS